MAFIPSMWTAMFVEEPPHEALEILGQQGWRAVELSDEHGEMLRHDHSLFEPLRTVIARYEIALDQMHVHLSADVASLDDRIREKSIQTVIADLNICAELGIPVGVIHPGGYSEISSYADLAEVNKRRIEAFAQLAGVCMHLGVRLAIENVTDRGCGPQGARRFGSIIEELLDLGDQVSPQVLGVCLDTSHANIQGLDIPAAIRFCGERLWALHISDNHGISDEHLIPGYGNIRWQPIVDALRDIAYDRPFNLEIPGARRGDVSLMSLRSAHALEICKTLLK